MVIFDGVVCEVNGHKRVSQAVVPFQFSSIQSNSSHFKGLYWQVPLLMHFSLYPAHGVVTLETILFTP